MILNVGAGGASTAEAVQYDNSKSGLEADNVQGALDEATDSLTFPDGTKYYADIQDGKHGFNTDPNRGADTFHPFRNTDDYYHCQVWTKSSTTNAEVSITETYTAETDCTLAITIVDYWERNLTGHFISTIQKNGEVVETNILYESGLNQISRTIVECKSGDVITVKCGVGAISSSQIKGGYIQIDQIA